MTERDKQKLAKANTKRTRRAITAWANQAKQQSRYYRTTKE